MMASKDCMALSKLSHTIELSVLNSASMSSLSVNRHPSFLSLVKRRFGTQKRRLAGDYHSRYSALTAMKHQYKHAFH